MCSQPRTAMIDVASRVKIVPLIRMKVLCYAPSKGRPLFQRRVSPFDPLRLSFDVRKHGFKAFEGARIGMLGLLDILATEKEETEPLPAPVVDQKQEPHHDFSLTWQIPQACPCNLSN